MNNPNAIRAIRVYAAEVPYNPLGSRWLGRSPPGHLDSTIVEIETVSGLTGIGESCPIGAFYLPSFTGGLRAALAEMAPLLLGQDAMQINRIGRAMDAVLAGHPDARAAIDIACWDLLGKHCAQPVSRLLGGRHQRRIPLYASIPLGAIDEMVDTCKRHRSAGYSRFQIKVGDDPMVDAERVKAILRVARPGEIFMVDANRGWSQADALRAIRVLNDLDCYLEQPCATYRECLSVRRHCARPLILDEVIDGPRELVRAIADDALDGLVIKLTHAGGLSMAKIQRDLCLAHGIRMRIEDTAGTEIVRAAQAQLAAATPLELQLGSYAFASSAAPLVEGAPEIREGMLHLNDEPGLGLTSKPGVFGEPLAVYG